MGVGIIQLFIRKFEYHDDSNKVKHKINVIQIDKIDFIELSIPKFCVRGKRA